MAIAAIFCMQHLALAVMVSHGQAKKLIVVAFAVVLMLALAAME